jgi:nicotinamidase-related amidase
LPKRVERETTLVSLARTQLRSPEALMLIDVQRAIEDAKWTRYGSRNNPAAESNMKRLLDGWRARNLAIYHIRHDSLEADSPYRPGHPGHEFKPEVAPAADEVIVQKRTNSAFIGTDLEKTLRGNGHTTITICGVITNNSVEATVRMAGNLGFTVYLAEDACFTFARLDWVGRLWTAEQVHALSLANLHGEYCTVLTTQQALARLPLF